MVAPPLVAGAAGDTLFARILNKAEEAAESVRPTRVVLLAPKCTVWSTARENHMLGRWQGVEVALVQNEAARSMTNPPCAVVLGRYGDCIGVGHQNYRSWTQ